MRRKRKTINKVSRPTHPGRAIYTAILSNKMSVGEIAAVVGLGRNNFVHVLRGNKQLTPRMAFLLAEFFSWDLSLRWLIMQTKCNMYDAAIRERKARKALMLDDISEIGSEEWDETVRQAWGLNDKEDPLENDSYPVLGPKEDQLNVSMKEELDERRDEDGMAGLGRDVRTATDGGDNEEKPGDVGPGLHDADRAPEAVGV